MEKSTRGAKKGQGKEEKHRFVSDAFWFEISMHLPRTKIH
jgi:hypothetical protein